MHLLVHILILDEGFYFRFFFFFVGTLKVLAGDGVTLRPSHSINS